MPEKRKHDRISTPTKKKTRRSSLPAVLRAPRRRRSEVKTCDVNSTSVAVSTTGVFTCLNIIEQGAAFYQRVGLQAVMKSLRLSGFFILSGTNAAATALDYVRLIIFYDRQANKAFPSQADILQLTNEAGTTESTSLSNINMYNRDRFKIIRDDRILLPPAGAAGVAANSPFVYIDPEMKMNVDHYVKLGDLETQYNQTNGGSVADIQTGSLNLLVVSNQVLAANSAYDFVFTARLRYMD